MDGMLYFSIIIAVLGSILFIVFFYFYYKWSKRKAIEIIAEGVRRGAIPQHPPPPPPPPAICPTCGGALTYIQQYQRWYCYKCKKYV